jgi:hypothetical protein
MEQLREQIAHAMEEQRERIVHAIRTHASVEQLDSLVKEEPRVLLDGLDRNGVTLLHVACSKRGVSLQVVDLLIQRYPQALTQQGTVSLWTPMHYACICHERGTPLATADCQDTSSVIQLLIQRNPAAIQMRDARGMGPIHQAVRVNLSFSLISQMGDFDPQMIRTLGPNGLSVLSCAARGHASLEVLCYLVKKSPAACLVGFEVDASPFHAVCRLQRIVEDLRTRAEWSSVVDYMERVTNEAVRALHECLQSSACDIPPAVATHVQEILSTRQTAHDASGSGSGSIMGVNEIKMLLQNESLQDLLQEEAWQELISRVIFRNQAQRQNPWGYHALQGIRALESVATSVDGLFLHLHEHPHLL